MTTTILTGCCLSILSTLPDQSVHTCVTSPPYFGLRDYGVEGQIGLEPTPDEFVEVMVRVFREVRRVLRDDGTLWLNLGDSYATKPNGPSIASSKLEGAIAPHAQVRLAHAQRSKSVPTGLKHKDLLGIPWRVALALQADGWYLRSDCIWSKPNPMPESVTDRPTKAHEYLFLLSKNERYFYDHEAVKEPVSAATVARLSQNLDAQRGSDRANGGGKTNGPMKAVGSIPKQDGHGRRHAGFNDRYFAGKGNAKTFRGGGAYTGNQAFDNNAEVERTSHGNAPNETGLRNRRSVWEVATVGFAEAHFATFPPKLIEPCILAGCPEGGTVLDPFFGAGTTGLVADRFGRHCVGIELNPDYVTIAEKRLRKDAGMLADIVLAG